MFDVITIGSATKDVFLISKDFILIKSNKFNTGVGECFAFGAKIEVADIFQSTGGGATNAAVTFANLGIKTAVVTNVGNDLNGAEVINVLKSKKVNTSLIRTDSDQKTGYSTILLSAKGERTILVYRGASSGFETSMLKQSKMKAKWFYLTSVAGNVKFLNNVFKIAQNNITNIFWNPGGAELSKGLKTLTPFLKKTTILSLNKEESAKLTGKQSVKDQLDILGRLVPLVWVTDGKVGAYLCVAGEYYFVPSLGTPALNTTGAGDAFGSGFLAGIIKSDNWKIASAYGILNSDSVIQSMGAKTGILKKNPSLKELSKVRINNYE